MGIKRPAMNTRKTAEYLACSTSYVYRLFNDGVLDGFRLGGRKGVRIYVDSAEAFIMDHENEK
ncbi:MerR family transcriptional regulator [Geomonas agri]|uniref:hypothetical protein n=1 Tax=Geomonas agri TaxID=2873702 RepID=UPI001CD214FD|nr:hypothetical protein [Geomonas agri]